MSKVNMILEGLQDDKNIKKEIENNPIAKKIKSIATKYGYEVSGLVFLRAYSQDSKYRSLNLNIRPKSRDYHPDVYISDSIDKNGNGIDNLEFSIQTTSYGSIEVDEYQEFLKSCEDAYKMMSEIKKLDLSKLTVYVKEF